jgi:uncharacterized protein YukJ
MVAEQQNATSSVTELTTVEEGSMPLTNYHVLVGTPTQWTLDDDSSPHIEIRIDENDRDHRIAVNARSQIPPHSLLYVRLDPLANDVTEPLDGLNHGLYDLRTAHPALRLDYVHGDLVNKDQLRVAPYELHGANNDLKDHLVPLIEEAIATKATMYAFGETWHEPNTRDKYFGFLPGRGIHDIHMNQGSTGRFATTNGPAQDGGLIIKLADRWVAILLAFQTQSWTTDPATGHPTTTTEPRPPVDRSPHHDATIQIIAALINAPNPEPGRETVTLINTSDTAITLDGWQLRDDNNRTQPLTGTIAPGDTRRITLDADTPNAMRLINKHGTITLADFDGNDIHAVTYQKTDVGPDGWTTLF